jgi:hypothetical protein
LRHTSFDDIAQLSPGQEVKIPVELVLQGSSGENKQLNSKFVSKFGANDLGSSPAKYTFGRTTDYAATEVQDPTNTSSTLLRFGRAYGMSNIQSITNKMKRGIMPLDLVEVMACPSGCLNGGGQIKTVATETKPQTEARLAAVRAKYSQSTDINDSRYFRPPEQSLLVQFLYGDDLFHISSQYRGHVRTRYHAIPKLETVAPLAAAAKW